MKYVNNAAGYLGLIAVVYGAGLIHPAMAWCTVGLVLFAAGLAGERVRLRKEKAKKP